MQLHKVIAGLVLAICAVALAPVGARAQVAAPVLNPTALLVTTENPAVLQWSAPSRVSLGWYGGRIESFNQFGVQTYNADTPGWFVQGRAVGESLSVGLEHLGYDITPQGLPTTTVKETQAALAGQLWGAVALGVGLDDQTQDQPGTTWTFKKRLAGASVRLFEHLYLGATSGTEQVSVTGAPASNRAVTRYGVGWHVRGDSSGLHLEATHEKREAYESTPGSFFDQGTLDTVNLEVIFANILVGLGSRKGHVVHPTAGSGYDENRRVATLGWVPKSGLAIALEHETWHRDFFNGFTQERPRDRVAVAWQF